ncbi:MAG: hypothetical protein KGY76_02725 [Candidatus Thermoplasmatota archaeon]|nr:hypothetical protein [Candidatus Thermoplasmatota archaeon]
MSLKLEILLLTERVKWKNWPICLVINEKTIEYSLLGNERFAEEVKSALVSERLVREPSTSLSQ